MKRKSSRHYWGKGDKDSLGRSLLIKEEGTAKACPLKKSGEKGVPVPLGGGGGIELTFLGTQREKTLD